MSTGSWRRNVLGLDITPKAVQALGENPTPASVRAALDIIGASRKTPEQKSNIYNLIGKKLLIKKIPERKDPDAIQMMMLIIDGVDGLIPPEFLLKYICRDSIQSGNIILVRHLFENPRFTDRDDIYVQVAIYSGHPEILPILVEAGVRIGAFISNLIIPRLIQTRDLDTIRILVEGGAQIDRSKINTIFSIIIETNDMKNAPFVIKLMYKHGLDPLMMAIEIGKPEIAVELFKAGARKTNNAVVIAAKKKGYTTFVKYVKDNFKVICDPLGYSQHTGQCWADSFQELFFFADGLKEFTQRIFYFLTDHDLEEIIARNISIEKQYRYNAGIKAIRDRFIHHYNYIVNKIDIETCGNPMDVKKMYLANSSSNTTVKRTASGALGISAASYLQSNIARERARNVIEHGSTGNGDTISNVIFLLNNLFNWFNIRYVAIPFYEINTSINIDQISGIGLAMNNIYKSDINYIKVHGHATGFLKCNKQWYYYNDNIGLIPTSITLVQEVLNYFSEILTKIETDPSVYCICEDLNEKRVILLDIKLPSDKPINYNKKIDFYSDPRFQKISKYIRSVYEDGNISSKLFTISRIYIQDRWIERSEAPDLFTRFETVSKTHKKITSEITYYFYFNPLVEMYAITPTTPSPLYSSSASSRKRSTRRQKRTRKLRH